MAAGKAGSRMGVDTGGTFTDFVWVDEGELRIHKELSTPADPAQAVLAGVARLHAPRRATIVHGSTVATNALLERRGARTALIATAGFADVLAIGRQHRPELYALVPQKPEPLVPEHWRFEVPERVTASGEVLTPFDVDSLAPILAQMEVARIESVAVCLLFSFLHPAHERLLRTALRGWERQTKKQGSRKARHALHISLSSEVLPEYREYERTAATVINAYVAPLMGRYLQRLASELAPRRLAVMQSNGGVVAAGTAAAQAARTVLSGPAGGVVGAYFVAEQAGFDEIITFDMGGTSTDVALCPGRVPTTASGEIAAMPLRLPTIDIHTVGAGGGSLATVDAGGALNVGPQSAGAVPGPVCYGLEAEGTAGDELWVTTTDANLVLGRLDADHFLGGSMRLHAGRADAALAQLAQEMGVAGAQVAAQDVLRVANATMERAIRHISVERGYDPRTFTLVAFGGAGPLHACHLARSLQIPRVLIPPVPGVLSALGMLVAAPTKDYSRTVMVPAGATEAAAQLQASFLPLQEQALAEMAAEGYEARELLFRRRLDMRYVGQSHELTISYPEETPGASLSDRFHAAHERRYGYRRPEAPVEIVTIRLVVSAPAPQLTLPQQPPGEPAADEAVLGQKEVWFTDGPLPATLYARARMRAGHRLQGPAVIFQYDTTTLIPPGWRGEVDRFGNLLLVA